MDGIRLTVVIPTLNEQERIESLVADLCGRKGVEVVVSDGGSEDGTVDAARAAGAVTVASGRGRARQMNAGAARAGGEAILFLHADSRLPEGFDGLVERALEDEETAGGAFSFALDEDTPFFRFITMTANFRSARMGIVFGDQAIFARTGTFREVGGYPEQPLMEDYELIRRLRKRGRIALLEPPVTTSSRRWREVGPLRNTLLNVFVTWAYVLGVSPERLRGWYGRLTGER